MKKFFWIAIFFLMLGSCLDQPECLDMDNSLVGISFKKMFDNKADTVAIIGITSPESDSIFYPYTFATKIALPLNRYSNQTTFTLEGVYDQNFLVLDYERVTQFVSEDCGTRYLLKNLVVNDTDFDSLTVLTTTLTDPAQPNLEVYRCPRTNLAKVAFRQLISAVVKADTVYLDNLSADYPATFFIPNSSFTNINLPLNPNAASTTFTFNFSDGSIQSITFAYTRTTWNEFSAWCGSLTLFSSVGVSAHDFSSIQISKDSIQDPPITNVAIFK